MLTRLGRHAEPASGLRCPKCLDPLVGDLLLVGDRGSIPAHEVVRCERCRRHYDRVARKQWNGTVTITIVAARRHHIAEDLAENIALLPFSPPAGSGP